MAHLSCLSQSLCGRQAYCRDGFRGLGKDALVASTSGHNSQTPFVQYNSRSTDRLTCRAAETKVEQLDWDSLAEGRITIGRNSWQKHKKMGKQEVEATFRMVQTLAQSSNAQLAMVRPYLCDVVYDSLIIAAGIKRSNQARRRQEKLTSKLMQQEHSADAILALLDMTEQMSMAKGRTGMNAADELALSWRNTLLEEGEPGSEAEAAEEAEALQREIVAHALDIGSDIAQLQLLLRRAREEERAARAARPAGESAGTSEAEAASDSDVESAAALEAAAAPPVDTREPTTLTAEQLAELMQEVEGTAKAPKPSSAAKRQNKRWRQALLKALKPVALHAVTPDEEKERVD